MVLRTVLLTGATGMVGRHVRAVLARRGLACVASGRAAHAEVAGEWQQWDLRQWRGVEELDTLFPHVDAILHVGAAVPSDHPLPLDELMDANVRASASLGQWATARGLPLVYLSGAAVYGDGPGPFRETDAVAQVPLGGMYGLSKVMAEAALDLFSSTEGLSLAILRPTSIYGDGLAGTKMVASFLRRAAAGEEIVLSPPVEDRINLIHAADVAGALVDLLVRGRTGVFNLAGPDQVSVLDLAQECIRITGRGRVRVADVENSRAPLQRFRLDTAKAEMACLQARIGLAQGLDMMWRKQWLPDDV